MTVHNGDEFWERGGLKFASSNWYHHLHSALEEDGGDQLLFSQYCAFMMNRLTDFVSQSFDPWIDSIIIRESIGHDTSRAILDSLLSMLKVRSLLQVCNTQTFCLTVSFSGVS